MPIGKDALLIGAQHIPATFELQTANFVPAAGDFVPGWGYFVTKASTIPASATSIDELFLVTGKCLITLIVGESTSVVATTTSLTLRTKANTKSIAAITDIVGDALGALYIVTGDPDDGLNGDATGATTGPDTAQCKTGFHAPILMNDETIEMLVQANGTGQIKCDLCYIPLEASAVITSVA